MSKDKVCVAGIAVRSARLDKEENYRRIADLTRIAAHEGAKIVCTPEAAMQGYLEPEVSAQQGFINAAEPPDGSCLRQYCGLARELQVYLAIGFFEKSGAKVYNSVSLLGPDGVPLGMYRKVHLAKEEALACQAGDRFVVVKTEYGLIGLMTCFDRQYPETARILALNGARLILNASAGGYGEWNDAMLRTRAYENKTFILFAHPMDCIIADPFGDIISRKGQNESLLVRKIDLGFVDELRGPKCARYRDTPELTGRWHNQFDSRRPELYKALSQDEGQSGTSD